MAESLSAEPGPLPATDDATALPTEAIQAVAPTEAMPAPEPPEGTGPPAGLPVPDALGNGRSGGLRGRLIGRWPVIVLALVLVAAACGGDDATLTPRASRSLGEQIDLVEFTIVAGEYEDARRGLEVLRQEAIRLTANGAISTPRAPEILVAIQDLEQALDDADPGA